MALTIGRGNSWGYSKEDNPHRKKVRQVLSENLIIGRHSKKYIIDITLQMSDADIPDSIICYVVGISNESLQSIRRGDIFIEDMFVSAPELAQLGSFVGCPKMLPERAKEIVLAKQLKENVSVNDYISPNNLAKKYKITRRNAIKIGEGLNLDILRRGREPVGLPSEPFELFFEKMEYVKQKGGHRHGCSSFGAFRVKGESSRKRTYKEETELACEAVEEIKKRMQKWQRQ